MLGPKPIATSDYPVATAPLLGFEQQLYVVAQPFTDLGILLVAGVNSGTFTASAPAAAVLANAPQELLLINETVQLIGDSPLVVQVVGTDATGAALSGVATFTPPGYANDKNYDIHQHRAAEIIPYQGGSLVDGKQFKTIASVQPISASAAYVNGSFRLVGLPPVAGMVKVGTKVDLEFDEKVQEPVAIQDGKDKGRYIKPGEIPVGSLSISSKDPSSADGLRRYNGLSVTGLVKEIKQDRVATQHIWFGNLIMTVKPRGGEGQEAVTLQATAMYQTVGAILAQ